MPLSDTPSYFTTGKLESKEPKQTMLKKVSEGFSRAREGVSDFASDTFKTVKNTGRNALKIGKFIATSGYRAGGKRKTRKPKKSNRKTRKNRK
jgi:hypothetical protein